MLDTRQPTAAWRHRHARLAQPQRPAPVDRAGLLCEQNMTEFLSVPVRPVSPAAPYLGGKRNLAGRLTKLIDASPHHTYVEPFVSMGGVFLRRADALAIRGDQRHLGRRDHACSASCSAITRRSSTY